MDLSQFLSLLLFLFLLFLLTKKTLLQRNSHANKLPPGPWKLPIIGSLHHLIGEIPHRRLASLAKTYGPLLHLKLGEVDLVVITSPELASEVMKTHDKNFASRPPLLAGKVIFYNNSDIVFSPYGNYWWQLRKICSMNILGAKRVKSFSFIREEEGENLVKKVRVAAGSSVNMTEMLLSAANSTITKTVFGKECAHQKRFLHVMREIMSLSSGFNIVDMYPSLGFLGHVTGLRSKMERAHRTVDAILTQIIMEHQARENHGVQMTDDLVDALLQIKKHGELDLPLTLNTIKAVILNFFIGGTDTTSGMLIWAMLELIRHPDVMNKAQTEVRKVFNEKKKTEFTTEVEYVNCIIKETLRLHTITPLVPRICHETIDISGYRIRAGTRVVVNEGAIMKDPKHWVDPESFHPDRFEDNSLGFEGENFCFTPFGAGRRICVGMSFAMATMEHWLAQLLFHFDWHLPDGMKVEDLDTEEVFGATVVRKSDLHLVATPYV